MAQFANWLKVEPQRELGYAVTTGVAIGRLRLSERRIREVVLRVLEVRVIEQIKEVGIEAELRGFRDLECFADPEIEVGEHRSGYGIAAEARVTPESAVHGCRASC